MNDLISRQAAIEAIEKLQMPIMRSEFPEEQFIFRGMSEVLNEIKELPSAQPETHEKRTETHACDCISRQAAVARAVPLNLFGREVMIVSVSELENLPSAQPQQQWIPCSERLPEIGQSVLLSVGGMYSAEGCLREDGDWAQFRWDAIQRKDMVGAWKPLPEPYKGD